MGRAIDMKILINQCYGSQCPHEIKTGMNAGNCGKPFNVECPDQKDQEEDTNE